MTSARIPPRAVAGKTLVPEQVIAIKIRYMAFQSLSTPVLSSQQHGGEAVVLGNLHDPGVAKARHVCTAHLRYISQIGIDR